MIKYALAVLLALSASPAAAQLTGCQYTTGLIQLQKVRSTAVGSQIYGCVNASLDTLAASSASWSGSTVTASLFGPIYTPEIGGRATGTFGIKVSSPIYTLSGGPYFTFRTSGSVEGAGGLGVTYGLTAGSVTVSGNIVGQSSITTSGGLFGATGVFTSSAAVAGTFYVSPDGSGNVGIRTAAPNAELEVKSTLSGSAFLRGEAADGSAAVTLNEEVSGAGSLYIYTNDEAAHSRISSDQTSYIVGGNVGIVDTNPTQTLDVTGTIGISDVQAVSITGGNFVFGNPAGGGTQDVLVAANGDYRLKVQGNGGVHVPGGLTASSVTATANDGASPKLLHNYDATHSAGIGVYSGGSNWSQGLWVDGALRAALQSNGGLALGTSASGADAPSNGILMPNGGSVSILNSLSTAQEVLSLDSGNTINLGNSSGLTDVRIGQNVPVGIRGAPTAGTALSVAGSTFTVTPGGIVGMPSQPHAMVRMNVDQSIPNATATPLYWAANTTATVQGMHLAASSDTVTVPVGGGGGYTVSVVAVWSGNSSGYREVDIQVNGASVLICDRNPGGANTFTQHCVLDGKPLNAGDTIKVLVYQDSAASRNVLGGNNLSYLSVRKVW